MLRANRCLHNRRDISPQVIGAPVPTFRHFPYRARDVLYLYRDFLRLIYKYPPQERADLLFRLRDEFHRKRHLTSPKMIASALRRGDGILSVQRTMLESRSLRARTVFSKKEGAQSVDDLWDQLQIVSGNVLPGLRNFKSSRNVSKGSYARQAMTDTVYSRRK